MELLPIPPPHMATGPIPTDDAQIGSGFFVGGLQVRHYETQPVTPRRYVWWGGGACTL